MARCNLAPFNDPDKSRYPYVSEVNCDVCGILILGRVYFHEDLMVCLTCFIDLDASNMRKIHRELVPSYTASLSLLTVGTALAVYGGSSYPLLYALGFIMFIVGLILTLARVTFNDRG